MKKTILLILCVLLSLSLFSCKKRNDKNTDTEEPQVIVEEEETNDTFSFLNELNEKIASKTISADDYVACTLLNAFKGNNIPEAYEDKTIEISDIRPYLDKALAYWDELSEQTQRSIVENILLSNVEFQEDKQVAFMDKAIDDLFEKINAKSDKMIIDNALLSKDGNFIIWYSDTNADSVGKEKAQIAADCLDEAVKNLDSFFNVTYRFVSEHIYENSATVAIQEKILAKNGINPNKLKTCMNVYLTDFSDSDVGAFCFSGFDEFGTIEKGIIPLLETVLNQNVTYGVKTFPYIAIDSDHDFNTEMKQILCHELFHYYQKRVLKQTDAICDGNGIESTANWAAAMNVQINDNTVGVGVWSTEWAKHCSQWFAVAQERSGYGLYPAVYAYQQNVENGKDKIIDALYEPDFLVSLQNNSTVLERKAMMADLAIHTFANDYSNPAFNARKNMVSFGNLSSNTSVSSAGADKLSIHYYQVNETISSDTKLSFSGSTNEMSAVVFAKTKDGKYSLIKCTEDLNEIILLSAIDNLDHYYVAVCNSSFTLSGSYSIAVGDYAVQQGEDILRFEKTVLVDNDDIIITALGGSADGRWIDINCEYQSKSSATLYLKDDMCILNGYTLGTIIDDASWYGMVIEPKSSGKLTYCVDGTSISRSKESYKEAKVTIKDEYCIDNGFDLTLCFEVKHIKGEDSENDYTIKGNKILVDGGASAMPDSIIGLYTTMDTAQLAKLKMNKIIHYQQMNMSFEGFNLIAACVMEYKDGTHVFAFEIENTSDSDLKYFDYLIGVKAINGIACEGIYNNGDGVKAHTKALCYIDAYCFSAEERLKIYGLTSIGTYDITVHVNHKILLEDYTIAFGQESACNVGQLLYEDNYSRYYYVGAGPRLIYDSGMSDILLVLKKEMKTDFIDISNIKAVYVDEELADDVIIGTDCIRNGAYYELILDNIDPTIDHQLKIVTKDGYASVKDEIIIPYIGQPDNN